LNYHDVEISDDVIAAVDAGRKIEAIKILREQSGLGLADAKHVADRLARERRGQSAVEPAMAEEGGASSMLRMVVMIGLILAACFYFFVVAR
jgi:ribosomal protein L7/L12